MKIKYQDERFIPAWALPYIFNSDSSGLTDQDLADLSTWEKQLEKQGFTSPVFDLLEDEPSFCHNPEFGLPTDCYKCAIVQFE